MLKRRIVATRMRSCAPPLRQRSAIGEKLRFEGWSAGYWLF
jgi:hypothetical protein